MGFGTTSIKIIISSDISLCRLVDFMIYIAIIQKQLSTFLDQHSFVLAKMTNKVLLVVLTNQCICLI